MGEETFRKMKKWFEENLFSWEPEDFKSKNIKTQSELMSFVNPIVDSQLYKSQDFAKRVQFKRTFESETADSFRDIQRDVALLEAEERGRAEVGFVSYQRQVKALMTRGYSREEAKNILK